MVSNNATKTILNPPGADVTIATGIDPANELAEVALEKLAAIKNVRRLRICAVLV